MPPNSGAAKPAAINVRRILRILYTPTDRTPDLRAKGRTPAACNPFADRDLIFRVFYVTGEVIGALTDAFVTILFQNCKTLRPDLQVSRGGPQPLFSLPGRLPTQKHVYCHARADGHPVKSMF
jgi:hypothetical protein